MPAGTVTVATTAVMIAPPGTGTVYVQNTGATAYFGGPDVTSSGSHAGPSLATATSAILPATGHGLYAISATSTSVSFLFAD